MSAEELLAYTIPYLQRMFPEFNKRWILDFHLWHAHYSQPIVERNYSALIPSRETLVQAMYISTIGISYAFIGTVLFIIFAPNFCLMPGRDSGAFLYIAQNILQGKLPYVDLWDHKPPMIFWIDAPGLYLGNG